MLDSAIRSEMVANHRFRHMRIQSRNKDTILILSTLHLLFSSFLQRIINGSVVTAAVAVTATATTTATATANLAIALVPILP